MTVFNRHTVSRHRDRAAAGLLDHDFLFTEVGERLADRLDDVKRTFPVALDLGCRTGILGRLLNGRGGIETLVQSDLSAAMVTRAGGVSVVADEEYLPYGEASFDLVLSNLTLHWINDLPGTLAQVRRSLKPDSLFLAAMLGGDTLVELRQMLYAAETELDGGLSPRVSPFADVRDLGNLLTRAGFMLPVADTETITVSYPHPMRLMDDLRGMGESNAQIHSRKGFTRRTVLMAAAERYIETFGDSDGRIPATFQVVYLTAWSP